MIPVRSPAGPGHSPVCCNDDWLELGLRFDPKQVLDTLWNASNFDWLQFVRGQDLLPVEHEDLQGTPPESGRSVADPYGVSK